MKYTFTIGIILTLCFTQIKAFAQDEYDLRWGGKVGVNLFNISNDPSVIESDAAVGTEFGFFGRIGERFYIQPEFNFVSNKVFLEQNLPNRDENDGVVVRYIRTPVYLGYRTTYDGRGISHLRFMAGPSFAYAVNVNDNELGIQRRNVRNAQFAINGGVGIDFWVLSFDLLYHHSFSTFLNYDNAEGKGRSISLSAGLSF